MVMVGVRVRIIMIQPRMSSSHPTLGRRRNQGYRARIGAGAGVGVGVGVIEVVIRLPPRTGYVWRICSLDPCWRVARGREDRT